MTPVRAPAIVRGDVPGLFKRGTEATYVDSDGTSHHVLVHALCADGTIHATTPHGPGPMLREYDPRDLMLDWHLPYDPMSVYRCLHWLADRGHLCGWMLPATHGGRVEAWDGLTAWEVSAILVSVSVGMVAAGKDPVPSVLYPWRHDPNPGDAYESWGWTAWMRDSVGNRGATRTYVPTRPKPDRWNGARWLYYRDRYGGVRPTQHGPETGDAGKLAADRAALADGCAICVPGGLVVPA